MVLTRSQARRRNSTVSKTLELPIDLIFDIMSRLPVKSLLRFKSVSKTWYNLTKNPNFIKQHQKRSKQNPNLTFNAVLSIVTVRKRGKQIFRINLIDALDKPIDIDLPFLSDQINCNVLGICNGLVCVMLHNNSTRLSCIAICNPLIEEFRILPSHTGQYPILGSMAEGCMYLQLINSDTSRMYVGFGLNGDNGYEFFRIVYELRNGEPVLEGHAYSLTNSSWRKIDIKKRDVDHLENHSKPCECYQTVPVFVHGVFYWAATDCNIGYVVSYDVGKEVFDEFLAPYGCTNDKEWILCDLKEEVAVVIYHDHWSFDIWVLNAREKSWELKLEMEESSKIKEFRYGSVVIVLGRARSGELVIEDYDNKTLELFLYDMYTNNVEDLPYVNVDQKREVFLYSESLVSVNPRANILRM